MKVFFLLLPLLLFQSPATSAGDSYRDSLVADFPTRDAFPETSVPSAEWATCCGTWGPRPAVYPPATVPGDVDEARWRHDRVIEVAKHYLGLPYAHRHIPAMGGLDCSNFTSWVYNFGFGVQIISNVHEQAETAGRKLDSQEPFIEGDLLYIWSSDRTKISHVALYIDLGHIIDSTEGGVEIRPFTGWYKARFAWARRVF